HRRATVVEQLVRPIAPEPLLQEREGARVRPDLRHRHLVRAPGALGRLAVDLLRAGPALGGARDDHRPDGTVVETLPAGALLDARDVVERAVERRGELTVHVVRLVA